MAFDLRRSGTRRQCLGWTRTPRSGPCQSSHGQSAPLGSASRSMCHQRAAVPLPQRHALLCFTCFTSTSHQLVLTPVHAQLLPALASGCWALWLCGRPRISAPLLNLCLKWTVLPVPSRRSCLPLESTPTQSALTWTACRMWAPWCGLSSRTTPPSTPSPVRCFPVETVSSQSQCLLTTRRNAVGSL